ncbi:hypothetical protein FQN49_004804, partial [Arthroderma sp. PD_2]
MDRESPVHDRDRDSNGEYFYSRHHPSGFVLATSTPDGDDHDEGILSPGQAQDTATAVTTSREDNHELNLNLLAQVGPSTPGVGPNLNLIRPSPHHAPSPAVSPSAYPSWPGSSAARHSIGGSSSGGSGGTEAATTSITGSTGIMSERENINLTLRPQRPLGPARTPSNTYAPPRRPNQFVTAHSTSQLPLSSKRTPRRERDRDPNAQYQAQEKAY